MEHFELWIGVASECIVWDYEHQVELCRSDVYSHLSERDPVDMVQVLETRQGAFPCKVFTFDCRSAMTTHDEMLIL